MGNRVCGRGRDRIGLMLVLVVVFSSLVEVRFVCGECGGGEGVEGGESRETDLLEFGKGFEC